MVIFQGWLGSIVVESELMPGMITLHMLLAMILLSLLISLQAWSSPNPKGVIIPGTRILYGLIILQVILGTQVREKVDEFTKDDQGIVRGEWLDHAGLVDHLHRPLSLLVLGLSLFIWFQAKRKRSLPKCPFGSLPVLEDRYFWALSLPMQAYLPGHRPPIWFWVLVCFALCTGRVGIRFLPLDWKRSFCIN